MYKLGTIVSKTVATGFRLRGIITQAKACAYRARSYRAYRYLIIPVSLYMLSTTLQAHPKTPRDPTQPPSYANMHFSSVDSEINITAIFASKNSKRAIIGNHIFTIGDKISGATIIKIDTSGVTLKDDDDGSKYTVTLSLPTIKTTATKQRKTSENVA